MDLSDALYAHLIRDVTLSALLGTRIFPIARPQEAELPAVVYRLAGSNRDYVQEGWTGRSYPIYQMHVHATTYSSGRDVATALVDALMTFQGDGALTCSRSYAEAGAEGYIAELLEFRFDVMAEFEIQEVV